jgi:phospholipase/lecithinase/hemolysin
MTAPWTRRAFLASVGASAAALAGCGSSTIESALVPTRLLSVGDGFSDLGQTGVRRTVNDGSVNIWSHQVATSYGLTLTASAAGGLSYAYNGARVTAAGTAPSIQVQIDTLLAANTLGATDVLLVNGGYSDIVAQVTALGISDTTTANVKAAGSALGAQILRLVNAGAKYVVVAGVYNLGLSPWAVGLGQATALTDLSLRFNDGLLVAIDGQGANVLFLDMAQQTNLIKSGPSTYNLVNVTDAACTTAEATSCTTSTIVSGVDYNTSFFADGVYPTPVGHRLLGTHAYTKIRDRW